MLVTLDYCLTEPVELSYWYPEQLFCNSPTPYPEVMGSNPTQGAQYRIVKLFLI